MSHEVTYILGGNIELKVEFNYTAGKPAVWAQAMEDSEPAEDEEIEINSITCNGKEVDIDDIYIGHLAGKISLDKEIIKFISTNRAEKEWDEE